MRRDLVEAARRGDHEAFEVLATSVGDRLYAVARLVLRSSDLAEDAVQEALVRAWQQLPSLRDPDRFDAWLHRLVVNACADQGRQLRRWSLQVRPLAVERSISDDTGSIADREQLERAFSGSRPSSGPWSFSTTTAGSRRPIAPTSRHTRGDRQITTSLRDRGDARGPSGRRAAGPDRPEQDGVMTSQEQLDQKISRWLEGEAPRQMPDRVLRATFERTRTSRQQERWPALLGRIRRNGGSGRRCRGGRRCHREPGALSQPTGRRWPATGADSRGIAERVGDADEHARSHVRCASTR